MELSRKQLEQLLGALEAANVSEFEYKDNKYSVRVAFGRGASSSFAGSAGPAVASAPAAAQEISTPSSRPRSKCW